MLMMLMIPHDGEAAAKDAQDAQNAHDARSSLQSLVG